MGSATSGNKLVEARVVRTEGAHRCEWPAPEGGRCGGPAEGRLHGLWVCGDCAPEALRKLGAGPALVIVPFQENDDRWIGTYLDSARQRMYWCPVPCLGLRFEANSRFGWQVARVLTYPLTMVSVGLWAGLSYAAVLLGEWLAALWATP